jgi:hypothetical protein
VTFRKFIIAIAATLWLFGNSHAQLTQQSPNQTGLVLEVLYLKGRPPAYQPVARSKSRKGGGWYALFGRIAGWQLQGGTLPITAVRLVPYLKNENININVSVLRGRFLETEDKVASFKTRESEVITVTELEAFGVEPFVLRVIRSSGIKSDLPTILNKTKSVAVLGIEPLIATLPRYKITLHNLSDKNIIALSVNIMGQGRLRKSSMPHAEHGEPLISARDSTDLVESLAVTAEATPGGYEPLSPPAQQIVVESLIFADGSYEGELKPAAMFLGLEVGRRIELKRILPLLDNALLIADAVSASDTLHSQLSSLTYEPDEAEVASLVSAFPTLEKNELRGSVEVAIHGVRKDLLAQLEWLQNPKSHTRDFNKWLVQTRELNSNWLSRLNEVNITER